MLTPKQICKAVDIGMKKMKSARAARLQFLSKYATRHYSMKIGKDNESIKASPLTYVLQAMNAYVPNLVFKQPKIMIRGKTKETRVQATMLETTTNHLIKEINLVDTIRKVVVDSLVLAGFTKTGIASANQYVTVDDMNIEMGEPYVDRVSPDDIILDPMARDWRDQHFMGNKYIARASVLVEQGFIDEETAKNLAAKFNDKFSKHAASMTDNGAAAQFKEIEDYVELMDIYFPMEKLWVTLPYDESGNCDYTDFLRQSEYDGPTEGPYDMLGYSYMPDNILPVPPAVSWFDIDQMANRVARKMYRQADRLKRVLAYEGTAIDDAKRIVEADDGETIQVDNIDALKEVQFGGATEDGYKFSDWLGKAFSMFSGNADMMSGGAAGSGGGTATEAELMQTNATIRLADAQGEVYKFVGSIAKKLAYYIHTDPMSEENVVSKFGKNSLSLPYGPEMRTADFDDFNLEIEPYSMNRVDPNMRARRVMELFTSGIPGLATSYQVLGPAFRMDKAIQIIGKELDIDDLDEMIDLEFMQKQAELQLMQAQIQSQMMEQQLAQAAAGMMMQQQPMPGDPSQQPSINPDQPNPMQMGPTGGISPDQESNAAVQESPADAQSARAMFRPRYSTAAQGAQTVAQGV